MSLQDELTSLTEDTSLSLSVPSRIDARTRLQVLDDSRKSPNPPVILWNLRPWNNFTLIHAIYIERLRYYQHIGFRTVIILYDNLVSKLRNLPTGNPEVQKGVDNIRSWLLSAGMDMSKTELFLESEIWQLFSSEILERLTSIAHSSAGAQESASKSSISTVLDNLCELVYEGVLRVDIVLTGGRDTNDIWNRVRIDSLERTNHSAPCVLSFPLIHSANQAVADTVRDDFSVTSDSSQIRAAISSASEDFLKQLFNLFLIPKEKPNVLRVDNKPVTCYDRALKDGISLDRLRSFAAEQLIEYFGKIK